jgi:hypothetical protein
MLDYEHRYKEFSEVFIRFKENKDKHIAKDLASRFYISYSNSILRRASNNDSENINELKSLNNAYNDNFPA